MTADPRAGDRKQPRLPGPSGQSEVAGQSEASGQSAQAEPPFAAIVLAGGAGNRLGGVSKPDVAVGGRRLLDHVLDATRHARVTVVVGPAELDLPPGVRRTLEDPPLGGPVAGISAGLTELDRVDNDPASAGDDGGCGGGGAELVLVLACDIPRAASAVPGLVRAAAPLDGACVIDASGRRQWLLGVYRRAALNRAVARIAAAGGVRDVGVRHLLAGFDLAEVPARAREADDVDTWADVATWQQ